MNDSVVPVSLHRRTTNTVDFTVVYPRQHHSCMTLICLFIVTSSIFIIQPCHVNAFTTLQQQQQQQQQEQQQQNELPNHSQQHHRTVSTSSTTPFKITAAAVATESFTTSRTNTVAIPPLSSATAMPATVNPAKHVVPSLGFGGSSVAVAPFTTEQDAANYYYYQQLMMLQPQAQELEDDDDDELMGLGTALITCALSLVIGFSLGYGT